ncbi:hypothetical protein PGTUg99_029626 [Puccinia graminis f. sp. tritici]|nr:hypothetical protein PGTUg99_029626 [Puccinia graminis f. sp. tritici]
MAKLAAKWLGRPSAQPFGDVCLTDRSLSLGPPDGRMGQSNAHAHLSGFYSCVSSHDVAS